MSHCEIGFIVLFSIIALLGIGVVMIATLRSNRNEQN